jgi:hypothetical protein
VAVLTPFLHEFANFMVGLDVSTAAYVEVALIPSPLMRRLLTRAET